MRKPWEKNNKAAALVRKADRTGVSVEQYAELCGKRYPDRIVEKAKRIDRE